MGGGVKEPDYIIYLFIENHFSRMNSVIYSLDSPKIRPTYEIDENYNIKEKTFFKNLIFISHLYKYFYYKKNTLDYAVREETKFISTMIALNKLIHKHWKNTKLIVLRYDEPNIEEPFLFKQESIEKLEENGIIFIDADKLVFGNTGERMIGEKYMQEEDQHPSAYAFELLSDKIAEYIANIK